ncbi:hypothetical protein [Nocardioides sp.]|uniref:hypothetical protein n=1 Tax=Nocardioides sp. TaxID=35761 RepID=UPI00286E4B5E|nr:hypothetical protein [Nocardioides sp.]
MFGLGIAEVLVVAAALGLALLASGLVATWVQVNQRWHVPGLGLDLERWLLTTLTSSARGSAAEAAPGRISLTQRRTPPWAVVLAVFTFPLGLVFLLHKVPQTLHLVITADERGGSRIDLLGVTRKRTLDALTEALAVQRGADAEPVSSRL